MTGDEIVPPSQSPGPGEIRDSNSTLVRAFMTEAGVEPIQFRVGERLEDARCQLRDRMLDLNGADLLLVSGGASVGQHDVAAVLLEELGYTLHVRRTTGRPGRPLIFGAREAALAFGLPGNPLAHFVCLHLYVQQALEGFSGATDRVGFRQGLLDIDFDAGANSRETFWPARLRLTPDGSRLQPLPWRSSGDLTSLASANALLRVPPQTGQLEAGATVDFIPTFAIP